MTRTTILFGPPGTGKTTALLKEVDAALRAGTPPDRIGFFAFTRKAAREAVERAVDQFSLKRDDLVWFRTLHSAAFRMLGLSSSDVMQQHHYDEFGKGLGRYTFEHHYDEDTERVPPGGAIGDIALGMYSRAKSRCTSIENEWRQSNDPFLNLEEAEWFAQSLDNYKASFHLLDFSDFLDEVHTALDLDLMILDESQDLTMQQWNFAQRIGAKAKRIIIAGDDDQAIFTWAGADVNRFLSFNGDKRVLPVSHRLPRKIWAKCNSLSSLIQVRQPKEWSPRPDAEGLVTYGLGIDHVSLRAGEWLMLARQRWQLKVLEEACREQGVVYQRDHIWSNQMPEVRAVVNYERLRRGEAVGGNAVNSIARYIPNMAEVNRADEYTWTDLDWPFEGMPDWLTALRHGLGDSAREYIRRLRRNNESLSSPGRVILSTIHGAKGGEADNVFLLTDTSRRIDDSMMLDPDQERRVWYVATSRAREKLFIAPPENARYHVLI